MDSKRNDMYKRAGKMQYGDWKPVQSPPVKYAEVEIPEVKIIDIRPPVTGVTPEVDPVETACGYCITPAMSYVPMQKWGDTYEPELGLHRGTIFPELDLPFVGEEACTDE